RCGITRGGPAIRVGTCTCKSIEALSVRPDRCAGAGVPGRKGNVTLTFCWDVSAANWIAHSEVRWSQLVGFGPAGFDAYARLRFLPDPARPGQSENDVQAEDWRTGQLSRLFEVLATHTATPEDCYFCVWEGFGVDDARVTSNDDFAAYIDYENDSASLAQPGLAPEPTGSPPRSHLPKGVI